MSTSMSTSTLVIDYESTSMSTLLNAVYEYILMSKSTSTFFITFPFSNILLPFTNPSLLQT